MSLDKLEVARYQENANAARALFPMHTAQGVKQWQRSVVASMRHDLRLKPNGRETRKDNVLLKDLNTLLTILEIPHAIHTMNVNRSHANWRHSKLNDAFLTMAALLKQRELSGGRIIADYAREVDVLTPDAYDTDRRKIVIDSLIAVGITATSPDRKAGLPSNVIYLMRRPVQVVLPLTLNAPWIELDRGPSAYATPLKFVAPVLGAASQEGFDNDAQSA